MTADSTAPETVAADKPSGDITRPRKRRVRAPKPKPFTLDPRLTMALFIVICALGSLALIYASVQSVGFVYRGV